MNAKDYIEETERSIAAIDHWCGQDHGPRGYDMALVKAHLKRLQTKLDLAIAGKIFAEGRVVGADEIKRLQEALDDLLETCEMNGMHDDHVYQRCKAIHAASVKEEGK